MIRYPLNYLKDLECGEHQIKISIDEHEALRAISMLTKVDSVPPKFDFTIVHSMKTGYSRVVINKEKYGTWECFPASTVMSIGLIRDACKAVARGGQGIKIAIDSEKDYGRLRTYISRSAQDVKYRRDGGTVHIINPKADADLPMSVGMGLRNRLDTFICMGSEPYIRSQVSICNRENETDYSVRKISPGVFCVIRRTTRDDSKVEAMYRTFLAVPSQANADALIEVVRGMVDSEQR